MNNASPSQNITHEQFYCLRSEIIQLSKKIDRLFELVTELLKANNVSRIREAGYEI